MNVLDYVADRHDRNPMLIFCFAYQYREIRVPGKLLSQWYEEYLESRELPTVVSDYCLEVLSGYATLPDILPPQRRLTA